MSNNLKNQIKKILEESSEDKKTISSQERRLQNLLTDDLYNHAEIALRLWGKKDGTHRSKFRKKLLDEFSAEFTPEEQSKITSILSDTSSEITSTIDEEKSNHQKVKQMLGNKIFNHAEVARKLWGDNDGPTRSEFEQKLSDDYDSEFTDDEVSEILTILNGVATKITKNFGKKR